MFDTLWTEGVRDMYKILICDDETDIRNALNIYLSAQGYETVLCANGQEALDAGSRAISVWFCWTL